ncbi:MAG: hypothetical protein JKY30_11405 [Flavobacteriales bacterium]|nr:hypothetical protein [Flavobacteriales bacterium]
MRILLSKISLIIGLLLPIFVLGNEIPMDSSQVELKQIEAYKIQEYQADRDFLYDRVPPPAEDWWEAFKRISWEWFSTMFDQSGISFAWDYLKWVLLAAVIIFVVLKIFKTSLRGLFQSKSGTNKVHFITEDEDIHEIPFDEKITAATAQKNYKEAIRLSFLKILKQLTDKDIIEWKVDKTNLDYLSEIKEEGLKGSFKNTSVLFEYVWYGEFKLEEITFNETISEFKALSKKLSQ